MSRAGDDLDHLRFEAWRQLAHDVRRSAGAGAEVVKLETRKHPVVAIGLGAALALLIVSRFRRPELRLVHRKRQRGSPFSGIIGSLIQSGLASFFSSSDEDDKGKENSSGEKTDRHDEKSSAGHHTADEVYIKT